MNLVEKHIEDYCEQYSTKESEVLKELNRETHANVLIPQMLSGHLQGRVLSMLSHMLQPKCILEIGTYTGYSAICFAEGLQNGGKLHTIDINDELEPMVKKVIDEASMGDRIQCYYGNAMEIIPTINETFDLVFIDADKVNYSNYFDLVIDKVRKGGVIIADNILWNGDVTKEKKDKRTQALHNYNAKINSDDRVENVILSIRDGLMLARKVV